MSTSAPISAGNLRPILPSHGNARVKSVLSGDTVILLGKATTPDGRPPEVVFTFEKVSSPRIASKGNGNIDEPGAFPAREWLRNMVIGKSVSFETRKQGATAGDRVYGILFITDETGAQKNLALECVRNGFATPKIYPNGNGASDGVDVEESPEDASKIYERELTEALDQAIKAKVGIHADLPLIRTIKNAGEEFQIFDLIEKVKKFTAKGTVKCIIEYVFDGSRFRCQVVDPELQDLQYSNFTLLLGGVAAPRIGNPRLDPPTVSEPFAEEARQFVELRLLQRELEITLHGTDKPGVSIVGTIHHPRGNIAVELLKAGLAKMSDWSVRMLNTADVPALRIAENAAKRTNLKVWAEYLPPQLAGSSEIVGTVVEVLTGDTVTILPSGVAYDSEDILKKVSLASLRAPRAGNEKLGRVDEPYSLECKERLRVLCVGKLVKVKINYERDIPLGPGTTERRQFGTLSVGKREDIGETLISEGLALTQRHRDNDEKSDRYDELIAAESVAKAAKKGVHSEKEYKKGAINDLADPRKAKAYSGSLIRAKVLKAVVDFVFNGARFRLHIPSENCHITFSPNYIRCPQPSAITSSRTAKAAEPFGDESRRHARLTLLQRTVEISCSGVTPGGVITGTIWIGQGPQRRDYGVELVAAGLSTVDQRKIDYGEAPKNLIDAQLAAQSNKVGIWSIMKPETNEPVTKATVKSKERVVTVRLSEIVSGNHFFFRIVGDASGPAIDESMKMFTRTNGIKATLCDVKPGKVVAALFDDGTGKSWYRAKILTRPDRGHVQVLFVDHGNTSTVAVATQLRPLDMSLGADRVIPVAKEAQLALTVTRPLKEDEGIEAAEKLQNLAWGRDLAAILHCEMDGKLLVTLLDGDVKINEVLISLGLARVAKHADVVLMQSKMVDANSAIELAAELQSSLEIARKSRIGMWRYGDIGDEDDDE